MANRLAARSARRRKMERDFLVGRAAPGSPQAAPTRQACPTSPPPYGPPTPLRGKPSATAAARAADAHAVEIEAADLYRLYTAARHWTWCASRTSPTPSRYKATNLKSENKAAPSRPWPSPRRSPGGNAHAGWFAARLITSGSKAVITLHRDHGYLRRLVSSRVRRGLGERQRPFW